MDKITLMNCSLCNNQGILTKEGEDSVLCPLCKGVNINNLPKPTPLTDEQCDFILAQMNSMTGDLNQNYGRKQVQEDWIKYWTRSRKFYQFPSA